MRKSRPALTLTLTLAATLTLAGCSSLGGGKITVAPSTFCAIYKPVRAGDALTFWDDIDKRYPEQSATIRGNNLAWQRICEPVE